MSETPLEQLIDERRFAGRLQDHSEPFFRLANSLLHWRQEGWFKRHHFQLISEAEALESLLDDYGARYNRTYTFFTELVASTRGFAQAGYAMSHTEGRLESYGVFASLEATQVEGFRASLTRARDFIDRSLASLLEAALEEAQRLGISPTAQVYPEEHFSAGVAQHKLPRNLDTSDPVDERQKIAEVASRFQQATQVLAAKGFRRILDPAERRRFLSQHVHEEHARELEAMVHNLQSAYDTYIKNTVLESRDERLSRLRGHVSATLHLLSVVTLLTHFYERHESDLRSEATKEKIAKRIDRDQVQEVVLNHLLYWSRVLMESGLKYVQAVLAAYTNRQELVLLRSEDLVIHARPAALIVAIVNHYGTPVEMHVAGKRCNAASILELLVTIGSHPEEKRILFRGDENPLRDIELLFRSGLGEAGLDSLPPSLGYLRGR